MGLFRKRSIESNSSSSALEAHVHFGVVDAECLDLDDDMTGLGLRVWNVFVNEAVEPPELLEDDCTHSGPPVIGTDSGREEVADRGRDLCGMRFQREVTRVEEADDCTRNNALERLGARRQEEGVVLAPHREQRRPGDLLPWSSSRGTH